MNFNKTTEYSLRILTHMAYDDIRLYKADEIYESLLIPNRYLRKQLTVLSKSGLLISIQGIKGGYKIGRSTNEISLLDIVKACEDPILNNTCFFGLQTCLIRGSCIMHEKWSILNENIRQLLSSTKLSDLSNLQHTIHPYNNFINSKSIKHD